MRITICGSVDRQLEELCRALKAQVASVPMEELVALSPAGASQPDLVVLDLRETAGMPPGLPVFRRQHPGTSVLIVARTLDPGLMLEAMRLGVTEYLTEPLSPAEFESAVDRLVEGRRATFEGRIIAFVGAKGGVGTTTMAVNVATVLAQSTDSDTLFIDLHLSHGDAGVFLGAEPKFSVVDALENTHRFDTTFFNGLVVETRAGFDLLASSDRAMVGGAETKRVRALLEFALGSYQYTILDVPRSDPSALEALEAATTIVVVANQEVATIRSAARIAMTLRNRYGRDKVKVAIARYDQKSEIQNEDIERVIGGKVKFTVPNDYPTALAALNKGRPLALENHTKLASSIESMARDLVGLPAEKAVETKHGGGGLFGFLGGRK